MAELKKRLIYTGTLGKPKKAGLRLLDLFLFAVIAGLLIAVILK